MTDESPHSSASLYLSMRLSEKAAQQYSVPEADVVIGDMKVGYHAEMIGTIRGWQATAMVGRKIGSASSGTVPANNLGSPYYSR